MWGVVHDVRLADTCAPAGTPNSCMNSECGWDNFDCCLWDTYNTTTGVIGCGDWDDPDSEVFNGRCASRCCCCFFS